MTQTSDTICAIATGNASGAIAVIRVSGPEAWKITSALFSKNLEGKQSHTIHFGNFLSKKGELIDEVLISIFKEGKSYTGEESVEISCHGSRYIQEEIIKALIDEGCRIAEPGEFTQRAFINGKLDLSQAEAVADLIASSSKVSHDIALKQLKGKFSSELKDLRGKLIHFASLVELELDFSEEDVEFADRTELKELVTEVLNYLDRLHRSFDLGNAIKEGVPVALVGAPNTGKSTLLNQLVGEERAIVSDIAGTTRDVIEETINIDGIIYRFIDTAGIRENAEQIEAIGIERSLKMIEKASFVICLADATNESDVHHVSEWVVDLRKKHPDKHIKMVINKCDLNDSFQVEGAIKLSAKAGDSLDTLKIWISETTSQGFNLQDETIITNIRHKEALYKTMDSLSTALDGLEKGVSGDFVAMDIRQAMFHLGTITGEISADDLLGNIFANFCIGK